MNELITRDVHILSKEQTIAEALNALSDSALKTAVFLDDNRAVAIVTDGDFVSAFLKGFGYDGKVFDIATKNVITLSINRDIKYAIDVLVSKSIKQVAVVDELGKFVGLLTQDAIIEYFDRKKSTQKLEVGDFLNGGGIISINRCDTVQQALEIMGSFKIGFLPVVDGDKIIGAISEDSILTILKDADALGKSVGEFMSNDVVTIPRRADIDTVLELMKTKKVNRVVVLDEDNKPIGVLSKRNLTKNLQDNYGRSLEKRVKNTRDALLNVPIPIVETQKSDGGYYVTWNNKAALNIFDSDLFDFKITDIISDPAFKDAILKVDENKKYVSVDVKEGGRDFVVTISAIDDDLLQIVFNDVTHIKENEKRLKNIIDALGEIVLITNGREIVSCNNVFLDFFGFDTLDDFRLQHQCVCDMFLEGDMFLQKSDDGRWLKEALESSKEGGESLAMMYDKKRDSHRIFLVRAAYFEESSKNVLVTLFDITERHMQRELLELQKRELEKLATTDALTGIYNRNKLKDIALYEFKKLKRERYPISIVIFDIDHFKKINDTFGHNVGDMTLKSIANIVKQNIRESDTFVRWGGEEFIVFCPSTTIQNAAVLAEKLRKLIEEHDFEIVTSVTCSFGIAQTTETIAFEELVENADKALYAAKNGGRNRVSLYEL